MKINFTKIKFKNFLSSGNVFTEVPLDKHNMTLIIGENGNGKSLIAECITFALFNKPYRNINKPQLVNSINQKELVVELKFTISENQYKIVRGIKPSIFQIYKNDVMIDQEADDRDYQQYLEDNILKMSYKTFVQTVIMGTASFTPFMQLTAQNRRVVVEDLLDLQMFSTMNVLVKSKINQLKQEIHQLDTEIRIVQEKIKLQEQYNKQIESNNLEQIQNIKQQIDTINHEIASEIQTLTDIQNKIKSIKVSRKDRDKLKDKIDQLTILKSQLKGKIEIISNEIDFFKENDQCPTCKQQIEQTFKQSIITSKQPQKIEFEDGVEKLQTKLNEFLQSYQNIVNDLELHSRYMYDIESKNNIINNKQREINRLQDQIIDLEKNTNIKSNTVDLIVMKEKLLEFTAKYEQLNATKQQYDVASILLKDTGIKSEIVKTYIPIINKFVNNYLEQMNFFVNFELDENFNEVIKSRHRDVFSYSSFSEGEKLRLNLALIFAWRDVSKARSSTTTNILFFDEILDSSLDYDGIDAFFKIINSLSIESNVFVISHKADMIDKFTNIIRVEKKKGFTEWSL